MHFFNIAYGDKASKELTVLPFIWVLERSPKKGPSHE